MTPPAPVQAGFLSGNPAASPRTPGRRERNPRIRANATPIRRWISNQRAATRPADLEPKKQRPNHIIAPVYAPSDPVLRALQRPRMDRMMPPEPPDACLSSENPPHSNHLHGARQRVARSWGHLGLTTRQPIRRKRIVEQRTQRKYLSDAAQDYSQVRARN